MQGHDMGKDIKIRLLSSTTVKGTLKKIKEDQRLIVYNLKTPLHGLSGSVYIHAERNSNHLWDRLVLEKE
jgi:hypothetical protein